jgi:hypothetical protein
MTSRLHGEYPARVDRFLPWGIVVILEDDEEVLVDKTKVGDTLPEPDAEVVVVILDDARRPVRGSLLPKDRMVARQKRGGGEAGGAM